MSSSWLAIVNPHAGYARSTHWRETIAARLQRDLDAEVVFTQYHGHASELAHSTQRVGLAVFGGDGTVAEVVNGMDLDSQRLLLLAGGTGNGLARDLGLTSIDMAIEAANASRIQQLDLIQVSFQTDSESYTRLAISTASVGYAAEVVVLANRYFKRLGALCYPLSATLQAARQTGFPVKVAVNEDTPAEMQLTNVMVNNTRHAGNFSAFRASNLSDGQMEVLLARANFAGQFLHNLAVLTRTYFYQTAAEFTARKIHLDMPSPQRLMIDGELWENIRMSNFEILPGRLQCVA